jgi:ketosteroid isomerase-like protein
VIESEFITWNAPGGDHPAQIAAQRSLDAVGRGDKDTWVNEIYAEDASIEDPVGPSIFDPEGLGHRGRAAISAFWDLTIAPVAKFHFTIHDSFANGNTCASVARFDTTLGDGTMASTDIVTVHTINDEGKIVQMRAHWEMERTMASLRKPE